MSARLINSLLTAFSEQEVVYVFKDHKLLQIEKRMNDFWVASSYFLSLSLISMDPGKFSLSSSLKQVVNLEFFEEDFITPIERL